MQYSIIQKSQLEGALRLDAEYYQPEYLNLISGLKSQKSKPLRGFLKLLYRYPTFYNLQYYEKGILILKGEDITSEGFIQNQSQDFISVEDSKKFPKTILKEGDLIFSVRGYVGKVGIVDKKYDGSIISANLIKAELKDISPYFVWVFLNSKYGITQINRVKMITAQETILADDIKSFLIPDINQNQQLEIENLAKQAIAEIRESESLYLQAEDLLLEELGLRDFEVGDNLWYIINLSDVKSAHRADAEYFQPKYEKLISKVKKQNAKLLGNLVPMKKGIEPGAGEYQNEGKLFIRVSSLSKNGIEDKDQKYLTEELYQKLKEDFEPNVGEILLTKDATPGIAYVVKEPIEGIISSGILRLRLKNKEIENEYLALCFNSIIGQAQAERDGGGSIITHWKPEQIKKVLIPILPKPTQQKIADLVQKSHEKRRKAKSFLNEAKTKVEKIIESKTP